MGRELQKKKRRSGIAKARPKLKSKKRLLHHPVIAANWNQTQTLSQNYARLGLTARLNKDTGGVEKRGSNVVAPRGAADAEGEDAGPPEEDVLKIGGRSQTGGLQVQEARVERDPRSGKIVKVVDDGSAKAKANPLNDPLVAMDSENEEAQAFNQHASNRAELRRAPRRSSSKVVSKLEQEAAASRQRAKYKPKPSENERAFIAELVAKYDNDYTKMARDIKINYMQRSEGDLKRRVKRWRESGGTLDVG